MPSDTIKVKVVFFASAKAAAGVDEWQAELPEGSKTTALRQAIAARFKLLGEHASGTAAGHQPAVRQRRRRPGLGAPGRGRAHPADLRRLARDGW